MFHDLDGILGGGLIVYVLLWSGKDVAGLRELGQSGYRIHSFGKLIFFLTFGCRALILLNHACWFIGLRFSRWLFWLLSLHHLA